MGAFAKATPRSDSDAKRVAAIVAAARNAIHTGEMTGFSAHADLDALSSNTQYEDIDLDEDLIRIVEGGRFYGAGNLYVLLNYGASEDAIVEGVGFSCTVTGRFDGESPIIEDITVNVAGFMD